MQLFGYYYIINQLWIGFCPVYSWPVVPESVSGVPSTTRYDVEQKASTYG